ncbi:MAG: hypothetical protein HC924_02695 [Synechococcaceae cyanobacterium SM2_3_2]|nr:hypothetical protein [Synechococcaceae cyanobacterium SM2_3_2]
MSATPSQQDLISRSLEQYDSNLIPLIIRPMKEVDPDMDYHLYEVVCGEEIYHAAKALKHKELWAWVFDLTDEAALQLRQDLPMMVGVLPSDPISPDPAPQQDPPDELRSSLARQEQDIAALKKTVTELQGHQTIWENMAHSLAKIQARLEQGIQVLDPPKPNINAASAADIQTLAGLNRKSATAIYQFIQQYANGIHAIQNLDCISGVGKQSIQKLTEVFSVAPISSD